MLSFVNSKTSLTTLAEWSPSDWPESLSELRTIDNLLRCSICYEYFDVAMIVPDCSHNYCSLCIRRSLSYEPRCPTCNMKLNPPSLKSNRVLDELVKSFVKVREKLLDLVTKGMQTSSEISSHKREGDLRDKNIVTSSKRRKISHRRPKSSPKSSSPGTKRQKLDDTEKEATTPENSGSSTAQSLPSESAVETEVCNSEQLYPTSEHEPMVIDEGNTKNKATVASSDPGFAECPVCGDMIPHRKINSHLDSCLTRTEKKNALRSKKTSAARSLCSTLTKKKHLTSVESKEYEVACILSSDDDVPSTKALTQEPCSSKDSSSLTTKGSNALIQTVQKRKPLPKLVYSVMPEKELRHRLKEWNLSTKGDKATLVKRHQDFVMLYNSQCDAAKPMTAAQIAREVEKAEKTRMKECLSRTEASTSGLRFDKNQTEEDMDKIRQEYLKENQNEFSKLISDVQRRQKGKRKTTARKSSATEIMNSTSNNPGENAMNTDSKDIYTDHTEGNNSPAEIKISENLRSERCTGAETQPQCIQLNSNELSLTCGQSEIQASVIPEPPSSPILLPLSDDDQESTPSLGLGDADDDDDELKDCEGEELENPNVIAESPVIKVGKAADRNPNKETMSSDSDDD